MPAAAACIQTFGDFLGFNPHLHILASDGCFGEDGMFYASPVKINVEELEPLSGEIEMDETMFGGRQPGKCGWVLDLLFR